VVIFKSPVLIRLRKSLKPWHWDEVHQKAFDNVKATVVKDLTLAYPDFTKPFKIYTDASKRQLGSMITQNNKPIAFFSRKLTGAQTYSVTEIELLAIVEALKEFKGMLWGQELKVYTDHSNLTKNFRPSISVEATHRKVWS